MIRKKTLEEKIAEAVRAEFAEVIADLERERQEYRRRSILKEETQGTLEDAEAQMRMLHSERIAFKERFWESYYGKGEVPFSELEAEPKALGRAIKRTEKALRKARADFERADFDEIVEGSELRKKADALESEAERRVAALEKALGDTLAEVRLDVEEACQTLRDECDILHPRVAEVQANYESNTKPLSRTNAS